MGLRAVTLGHAYAPVVEAVAAAAARAAPTSRARRPSRWSAPRQFLKLIPSADMVKFAKDGSTSRRRPCKLARAYTGPRHWSRSARDQPFFSYRRLVHRHHADDAGIPQAMRDADRQVPLQRPGLARGAVRRAPRADRRRDPRGGAHRGAARPASSQGLQAAVPPPRRAAHLRRDDHRLPLAHGGAQALYGVAPDLSSFGKALANGFALSALCGRRDIMELRRAQQQPGAGVPAVDHARRRDARAGGRHRHHARLRRRRT